MVLSPTIIIIIIKGMNAPVKNVVAQMVNEFLAQARPSTSGVAFRKVLQHNLRTLLHISSRYF